jgi:flagellar motor protein MotB
MIWSGSGYGLLLAATMLATGCQQGANQKALLIDDLMLENESLREELAQRNRALDEANLELRDKAGEVSGLRRELDEAQRLAATPVPVTMGQAPGYGATGFEGIPNVTGSISAGEITASISSDILFDSGKATLKDAAKRALSQVVSVLNSTHGGRPVRVGGHTDTDPIKKSGHKSNYHLGFERAYAVREYLVSKGLDPSRIHLASYGPDEPLGTKSQSRRVEIAVLLN